MQRRQSQAQLILLLGALSHACGPLAAIPALILAARELAAIDAGELPEEGRKQALLGRTLAWVALALFGLLMGLLTILVKVTPGLLEDLRDFRG